MALLQMVFCTSTITPAEGSTAESSSTASTALEKAAALAAVLLGDLDAHQAQFEELPDEVFAEDAGLIHFAHVRADLLAREPAHGVVEELFVFGQLRQRRRMRLQGFKGVHFRSLPKERSS